MNNTHQLHVSNSKDEINIRSENAHCKEKEITNLRELLKIKTEKALSAKQCCKEIVKMILLKEKE